MHNETVLNDVLERIFSTKKTKDVDGNIRVADDMIAKDEACALYRMVIKSNAKSSIEIGLAHGVSALVFCQAHNAMGGKNRIHYGVDPNQRTTYNGAAIQAVNDAGYSDYLRVLEGPSHLELPKLIEKGTKVQCALFLPSQNLDINDSCKLRWAL